MTDYKYIEFRDSGQHYGIIRIKEKDVDEAIVILNHYKLFDEEYDFTTYLNILEKAKIKIELIETEWVNF